MTSQEEIITALDLLTKADRSLSYEIICKMDDSQKKEYHMKLEEFKKYNSMNKHDKGAPKNLNKLKGESLEELASYLLEVSGGLFKVQRNLLTTTNEVDQIFKPTQKAKMLMSIGVIDKRYEFFLGECKNYNKPVDVTYVGKFCSLLLTNQTKLGILFSYHGVSGKGWNAASGLIKKFYLHKEDEDKRYCIINFNKDDFEAVDNGSNFLQIVEDKLLSLQMDTDYTSYISKHPAE